VTAAWTKTHEKAKAVLKASPKQIERGIDLHKQFLVCDTFGFDPKIYTKRIVRTLNNMIREGDSGLTLKHKLAELWETEAAHDSTAQRQYLEAFRESGVTCIVHNVGMEGQNPPGTLNVLSQYAQKHDVLGDKLIKALNVKDILRAKNDRKLCLVWSLNSPPVLLNWVDVRDQLDRIDVYHRLGVRMMHLTYNRRNFIGNGCTERDDAGLSDLGIGIVRRMNEIGVIVDTSHTGRKSTLDAAGASDRPIVASHTGCDRLYHHDRNKTDKEIRAIAGTGGLVGIYTIPHFLGRRSTVRTLLDHVDCVVKLVGVNHVSIGTDTCYVSAMPKSPKMKQWPRARKSTWANWQPRHRVHADSRDENQAGSLAWMNWPYFTVGLVTRGYSDGDIQKILGLNFLRVLGDCCKQP